MKQLLKKVLGDRFVYLVYKGIKRPFLSKEIKTLIKEEQVEIKNRMSFYRLFVSKGDLCFDVGANLGNRIKPLLKIGAKVVAVEPQPQCVKFLKRMFGRKITLVAKGLDSNEGAKKMYISSSHVLSSFSEDFISSVKSGRFNEYTWTESNEIEMTTLDKLIEQYGLPVFIKIDVEGYELNVLKGLTKAVNMISIEYTVPELTTLALDCITQIAKSNPCIEINYSIGESMSFALKKWLPLKEALTYIQSDEFISTGFGDIYIRTKPQ